MKNSLFNKSGFTLPEAIVASFAFAIFSVGVMASYRTVLIEARGGSSQARFLNMARNAEVTISRCIQSARGVSVPTSTCIQITFADNHCAQISYVDLDNDPGTVTNNIIRYDPDIWTIGGEKTICDCVRPLDDGSQIFTNIPVSPLAIRIGFHVGDGTNATEALLAGTGRGYQGTEVRFSATPRNSQRWYQQ
jgi:hypothetical protein